VNADYLVIRKMSLKRLRKKFGQTKIDDETADKLYKYDHLLKLLDMKDWADEASAHRLYCRYEEKRKQIGILVWVYLKLRNNLTNPILMVNDKVHLAQILSDTRSGEVKVRSTIEQALIADLKQDLVSGEATDLNYSREVTCQKMAQRYFKLLT